jgi:hypothetical protein
MLNELSISPYFSRRSHLQVLTVFLIFTKLDVVGRWRDLLERY